MARPNALQRSQRTAGLTDEGGWKGLGRASRKLAGMEAGLLPALGDLMFESIVHGSALTGAPGQPEAEGDLIASWSLTVTEDKAQVSTQSPYAQQNEDGVSKGGRPYVQKSARGGRHSVKLTKRGLQKLVVLAANESMAVAE